MGVAAHGEGRSHGSRLGRSLTRDLSGSEILLGASSVRQALVRDQTGLFPGSPEGVGIALKLPNHFIFCPGLSQAASDPARPFRRQLHHITSLVVPGSGLPRAGSEALLITTRLGHGQEGLRAGFDPLAPGAEVVELLTPCSRPWGGAQESLF